MKQAAHWSDLEEQTCLLGIKVLYTSYRLFGRWFFRLSLWPVVLFYWLTNPRARAASREYLQRIEATTGALGRKPHAGHTLRHIALFAETLLDKLLAISGNYPAEYVQVRGQEAVLQQIQSGKGGVLVTAHMGCLELCRTLADHVSGVRINVLVHTRHATQFNQLLQRLNPESSLTLIEVSEVGPATALMLSEKVAAGEWVAIAGDRTPLSGERTVYAPFLGQDAPFPIGPYLIAHLLQCPLYGMACIHQGSGYLLEFAVLAEHVQLPRAAREQALAEYAGRFAQMLTHLLARSPYDWFNFYSFWDQHHAAKPRSG